MSILPVNHKLIKRQQFCFFESENVLPSICNRCEGLRLPVEFICAHDEAASMKCQSCLANDLGSHLLSASVTSPFEPTIRCRIP
jgi:hypothetical protein